MEPSPHVESMTKQEAREVVDFINKAVDASILRNLVRSPNKDVSGSQRGKQSKIKHTEFFLGVINQDHFQVGKYCMFCSVTTRYKT